MEDRLADIAEQPRVTVIHRIGVWRTRLWGRIESTDARADDRQVIQSEPSLSNPDIASDSVFGEDERADRTPVRNVKKRGVAALVRRVIVAGEPHGVPS